MDLPASVTLLQAISRLCGWIYTFSWSLSFYPQALLNYRRKSTSGTTPSFPLLNVVGFASYSISSLAFYYSSIVQEQYRKRHDGEENTVRGNDVAFAVHALVLSIITLSQFIPSVWGFERRTARVGKGVWGIVGGCVLGVAWTIAKVVLNPGEGWEWIDVMYALGYVKILVTVIKYVPQAWANFKRKSTVGWSIEPILMDLLGGGLSVTQLVIDSSLQHDWSGITGNPVKFGLGNISMVFDFVFMTQHYILYRNARWRGEFSTDRERDMLLSTDEESRGR